MSDKNVEVKVAVVEEQIKGLRAQHKAQSDRINARLLELETSITDLLALMNKGKGAYALMVMISAGLGAVLIKVISYIFARV